SNVATVSVNVITPIATTTTSTVGVLSVQYSDQDTFTATIAPASAGPEGPGTMINFKVGSEIVGTAPLTVANGVYSATWTGQMIEVPGQPTGQLKPGPKVMTVSIADPTGLYAVSFPNKSLTIATEDARVTYTRPLTASLGGSATGVVTLTASVKDITAMLGDAAYDA